MSQSIYIDETPADVKNAKGLHLVTQSTPNGQKVQILLEELKDKYGLQFTTTVIDISTNEQKKEWFLRLNPNGRIPVLIDNSQSPPFPVFETSAILLYLVRNYDPDHHFRFKDELQTSQAEQWLIFWHGSGAPYQGNTNFFRRQAEQIPFAINRFRNETLRVYEVLEIQLSGRYTGVEREYLAGNGKGRYSVAELGTWPWVKGWKNTGFTDEELAKFPHLLRWIDRVAAREAVQRGIGEAYQKK
ncbi:hypothetical protein V499_09431 [Pseudogymnoascus sp. VKM F-103]|nr:hypothetical protein V499_09431 [Pseudogymnoascus sp. VKM F-103]